MPKICYTKKRFNAASMAIVDKANQIILEFEAQGFELTLRQLYYQFVARDIIPNNEKSYKNLGGIISDARLAGLIDWNHITDRTRFVRKNSHWEDPQGVIKAAANSYMIDFWAGQQYRPEVWIEKDALVGVIEGVCTELDVPYFSCRGYTSQSEMWGGAMRLKRYRACGKIPIIFHFGDHDPSGKDMTRDIVDRIELFMGGTKLERLALNMDQIDKYKPPPNPSKITDPRAEAYIAEFGSESWELDALEPRAISDLVRTNIMKLVNKKVWKEDHDRLDKERKLLSKAAVNWDKISEHLSDEEE